MKFRPRFSLRMLFVAIACFGIWLGLEVHSISMRKKWLDHIVAAGGGFRSSDAIRDYSGPGVPVPQVSWVRRLLGDQAIYAINVSIDGEDWNHDVERTKDVFPEAKVFPMSWLQ